MLALEFLGSTVAILKALKQDSGKSVFMYPHQEEAWQASSPALCAERQHGVVSPTADTGVGRHQVNRAGTSTGNSRFSSSTNLQLHFFMCEHDKRDAADFSSPMIYLADWHEGAETPSSTFQ